MENVDFELYLDQIASDKYSPGGGSASCHILMLSFALVQKSLLITRNRKSYENLDANLKCKIENLIDNYQKSIRFFEQAESFDNDLFNDYMEAKKSNNNEMLGDIIYKLILGKSACKLIEFVDEQISEYESIYKCIVKTIYPDFSLGLKLVVCCIENALYNMKENLETFDKNDSRYEFLDQTIKSKTSQIKEIKERIKKMA